MNAKRIILSTVLTALATLVLASAVPAEALDLRSWDRKFDKASSRFTVLSAFDDEAVLDKETQLVWQRSPFLSPRGWPDAMGVCLNVFIGGRAGWRLPTMEELSSLLTKSDIAGTDGLLPPGHPFLNIVANDQYWSATTHPSSAGAALALQVAHFSNPYLLPKTDLKLAWCVRGGAGHDGR
jgi:hypothetical protein